ncbi:hypothetical protein HYV43_00460 [Candidatus Micrarchaeota archaeon]|nr:hypothetical protein [Candidatus Micrarchaeota archaeon]
MAKHSLANFDLDEKYSVQVNLTDSPILPRPDVVDELVFVLIDKTGLGTGFHLSNHHWNGRLNGNMTTKTETGRKFFKVLSEGGNKRTMAFQGLKQNFIDEVCIRTNECYRETLTRSLQNCILP